MSDSEDRLAGLIYTRDKLAAALCDEPSDRDLPALSREYRIVLREIDSLHTTEDGVDAVDQLAGRRRAKGSGRTARSS
jgi:hypothetical protein